MAELMCFRIGQSDQLCEDYGISFNRPTEDRHATQPGFDVRQTPKLYLFLVEAVQLA